MCISLIDLRVILFRKVPLRILLSLLVILISYKGLLRKIGILLELLDIRSGRLS